MKVTLYMATSLNGFIARKNGDEDFLSNENWNKLCELTGEFGNLIWGRKTYEAVRGWDNGEHLEGLKGQKIIISHNKELKLPVGYAIASSPREALRKLEQDGFENALLSGGSTINTEFVKEGLIDEIIFNVEPFVLGEGIPVFSLADFELPLELISAKSSDKGITSLYYKVKKLS